VHIYFGIGSDYKNGLEFAGAPRVISEVHAPCIFHA
jgi:hypothetical protein